MSPSRLLTAAAVVLAWSAACSDDSKGSGGGVSIGELPAKYAAALCLAYQRCFGPLSTVLFNGLDCAELTAARIENGTFSLIQSRIDQKTIAYDGTKVQACLDVVSELTCDGLLARDHTECLAALDGTVALGGECDLNEECKGSAVCQSNSGSCPGKCVALLSAGQACAVDGDCADGLQCSKATMLCVRPATIGTACEYGAPPCGPGLLCLGKDDDKQTSGTCYSAIDALKSVEGQPCDPAKGLLCVTGGSCVADSADLLSGSITWLCVKTGSYKAGESCKPGIPEACSSGNYCKPLGPGLLALTGTCTATPDAQQACGTGLGAACKAGAVCVAGNCEPYAANGVACRGDDMCYSEYCSSKSGGCEPRLPCQ